jgi:hypothetical protein
MKELTKGIPNNQIEFLKKLSNFPKNPMGHYETVNTHRSDPDSRQQM